ncbi:MAG: hypothetical protein CM15mP65_22060 [Crocinitomicaceae bacterium]|nr:MAG: hypothetical protein CM15mP65_22060 [Crocinitomicaceae bacterium]
MAVHGVNLEVHQHLGKNSYDYSGRSISLNGSGNRLVVGAYENDVWIKFRTRSSYELSGTSWVKMGSILMEVLAVIIWLVCGHQ